MMIFTKKSTAFLIFLILFTFVPMVQARDIREMSIQTEQIEAAMKQKAAAELQAAQDDSARRREQLLSDKNALSTETATLKQQISRLQDEVGALASENNRLLTKETGLSEKLKNSGSMIGELTGLIRINAKDIRTLKDDGLDFAVSKPQTDFLEAVIEESGFPGMSDIRNMADLVFDYIERSGSVSLENTEITDRAGRRIEGRILLIGSFTAVYQSDKEIGFLNCTSGEQKFFALSRLPAGRMQKELNAYMQGKSNSIPMDISRGVALRQTTHELSLWEQIPKGGPIVWPIIAILVIGILIVMERTWFFLYRKINFAEVFTRIEQKATEQNWESCQKACEAYTRNPVIRIIQAGLRRPGLTREEMENTLQEAILKEIPPMERFLSTLGMLAVVAPLLGLLGTVTGMINTFHVITLHGTGDPRMMSGGISEALVTTMLGLSVAIPIMLAHTLLTRSVENTISLMEEKAVALINIIQRCEEK